MAVSKTFYTKHDSDVRFPLHPDETRLTLADIIDLEVTFTLVGNPAISFTNKLSNTISNRVVRRDTEFVAMLEAAQVTVAGVYGIAITATDTEGHTRGLEPSPLTLTFHEQRL